MKTKALLSIFLTLLLTACGALWQVIPLPPGTSLPSLPVELASPTFTVTPVIPTETSIPPMESPPPTEPPPALAVVTSPAIMTIDMLDELNGWASGETNMLRTEDGGATWLDITPTGMASIGYLSASFFADTTTAWFILPAADYVSGSLYHTIDGGLSWTATPVPFSGGSLQFMDNQAGWMLAALGAGAGSEAVAIFQTLDAGETWNRIFINDPTVIGSSDSLPLSGQKSGMTFLDAAHGWVTGSVPMDGFLYLYTTQDGGATWTQQPVSLPTGFETAMTSTDSPYFYSATDGIFHCGLYTDIPASVFYLTSDGGASWNPTYPVNMLGRYAIANLNDVWIWDGSPAMLVSHDSGGTWNTINTDLNVKDTLSTFEFVNASTGWALTSDISGHHSLYKTTDGGATWNVLIP